MSWTDPAVWMTLPTSDGSSGTNVVVPVVDITAADAYFATTPRDPQWQAVADKQVWLNEAQYWLNQLCYDTTRECCGNSFTASYTRAVSELALALSLNPSALISGAPAVAGLGPIKRQKLDALEVEYFDPRSASQTTVDTTKAPTVLRAFPWLKDIIGCWLAHSGSNQLAYRVRS